MSRNPLQTVVRHLRSRSGAPGVGASPDMLLLARYVQGRDEGAFEELLRRHGPLVWALCRSGLQPADAEDAFQATFVVLARRAGQIRRPAALACWLSGVARRVIRQVRRQLARRQTDSLPADASDADRGAAGRARLEWQEVLNDELHRMSDKYRLPIVLCYYHGLTNEEAAARLAWRPGTVCGRLARARTLLRKRLAGRGMTLPAGALAVGVAAAPAQLFAATQRTCSAVAEARPPGGVVASPVLQLAGDVMHTIWLERVKSWAVGTLAVVALGGGAAGWMLVSAREQAPTSEVTLAQPAAPGEPATPKGGIDFDVVLNEFLKPSPLAAPAVTDDELQKLRKERFRVALDEVQNRIKSQQAGIVMGTVSDLYESIKRLSDAEAAVGGRLEDRLAAYGRVLSICKWIESIQDERFRAGRIPVPDFDRARFERLDTEIKILELKRAAGKAGTQR